ncbi:MAG TPA: polysaccharide deacetylase family protein [Methylomirabilota bacterium]|nr:polysaccharide deacetylase family protein [Methylomirabilota bacterium]
MLAYHSVRPVGAISPSPYVIDPEQFARQMTWLAENNYHVVSFSAALEAVRTGSPLPPHTIVLSFDDGCRDNLTYAAPIVRRYGFTPIVFVCPDLFGLPAGKHRGFTTPSPLLTRVEALELIKAGWEIGGHTRRHPQLVRFCTGEELDDEIGGCREAIWNLLGYDAKTFAYPFGQFNAVVKHWVARHGYEAACSTLHGFNTARTDRFELRRLVIRAEDDLWEFRRKVQGAYDWLGYFKRRSLAKKMLWQGYAP